MSEPIYSTKHRRVLIPESNPMYTEVHAVATPAGIAKVVDWQGQRHLVLPHNDHATRVLAGLRINVPAPCVEYYDWGRVMPPPFNSQKHTAGLATVHKRGYILNGMGTGKTRSALLAFDWLHFTKQAQRMLVNAPLSTLYRVWGREALSVVPHLKAVVLHGTRDQRLKRLAEPADIYIINHDGVGVLYDELMDRDDIDVLCLDELAVYRSPTAKRTKMMMKLAAQRQYVWGMTGSPTPNAPTDAWAQCRIVTPWTVPKAYTHFRDQTMRKVSNFKWVPKPTAMATVHDAMQPAVRYTLDDVAELPEVVFQPLEVAQSTKQNDIYKSLSDHARTLVDNDTITAANAGVLMGKLLQVSLGWVYSETRGIVSLPNEDRMQALVDTIAATERKVIVFVPYIHALKGTEAVLAKSGYDVDTVSGETPSGERNRIFTKFQDTDALKVLVAHPQCMAHGLTLTAADTIVWLAPFPSLEVFDQANARITRVGQKHKQLVVMMHGTPIEKLLYKRLRQKQDAQGTLLELFRGQTEQGG